MPETLQQLLALPVPLPLIFGLGVVATIGVIAIIVILLRPRAPVTDLAAEKRMADLNARVQAMGELLARAQGQLQQTVHERLDAVTARLGESMQTSTKHTAEHLQQLHARLAVIDNAQKNITDLATTVTSLQNVLSNKQSRGAFGQAQLEAIVADILPKGAFEFQYTLSNRTRPDCVIFMPDSGPLVVDAKFPLEAMTAFRDAQTEEDRKAAIQRVKQDVAKHITDIAGKYLLPGETQDIALMFIPSESVYAELHERFDDIVQRAQRARVMIVSPTLMVMAIQVIKQVRKDAQMREAADQIRNEVGHMMKDVRLLGERVRKLQTHLGQTSTDVEAILTSAGRIEKRAARIEDLEFDGDNGGAEVIPAPIRSLGAAE
ncbi:DNA recombination protein RmuC [Microbacteriaceae bacterium K1510]|nr:DNA recombination protein RmuC [Microbacteriaceae bacterium K1510]